ncbi:MAG: type II toxin-antitoxin system RatA family toxin [Rhodospirillales bacterium]|nr:type II toxin-antitoxin system RatA family toxin [Alphaproteobacteria bacterium]USO03338.1 MAG: type II toxin-antitoxin system RatA family toxin [Rhodospirillales bacterium]
MPTHAEKKILPYSPAQLFDLVVEVEKYPQFLPWCTGCKIKRREDDVFYADLSIGYKRLRESFTSKVTALRPDHIHVEYLSGPMKYLSNHWRFIEQEDGSCLIDFYVDFEFKNPLLQGLMGVFFNEIIRRMVSAFETRAHQLYADQATTDTGSSAASPSK